MTLPMRLDSSAATVQPGIPVPLFATHIGGALQSGLAPSRQQYMVSRDGSRFLMNNVVDQDTRTSPITVIVNWKGRS